MEKVEEENSTSEIHISASDISEDFTDGIGNSDSTEALEESSDVNAEVDLKDQNCEILNEATEMEISKSDNAEEPSEEATSDHTSEVKEKEVTQNGVSETKIPCFYCDDISVDVKDTSSYMAHLGDVHSVKKNLDVLAELTIKAQLRGDGSRLDCVSPEPFEEKPFTMPENLSDFESDDDDDMFGSKEETAEKSETKEAAIETAEDEIENILKADEDEKVDAGMDLDIPEQNVDDLLKEEVKEDENVDNIEEEKNTPDETKMDDKDSDHDTLTLNIDKQDEFEIPPEDEVKDNDKKDDALSDLSLSDDDFDQSNSDWVVLDEDNSEDKENKTDDSKVSNTCSKCDTAHKVGERCSFILSNSKPVRQPPRTAKRDRGEHSGIRQRESEYRKPRERVRTLPPELYNNPNDYENRNFRRSRSPRRRPPTPPFEREGYEDRRDRRPRDDEDRRLYEKKYDDLYTEYSRPDDKSERKSCKLCSSTGHLVKNCPDLFCYKCDQQGHFAKECPSLAKKEKSYPSSTQSSTYNTPQASYTQPAAYSYPPTQQMPQITMTQPPPSIPMNQSLHSVPYTTPPYGGQTTYSVPPAITPAVTDHFPSNYAESLHSLQPLQLFMSAKMMAMPGQSYPKTYIDLLVTNVGKMLAQANLGLQALLNAFSTKGESFVRALISKELQVYAERFPGGVNMPLITHTTVEYLVSQGGMQHYPYVPQ
eukprot:GFUD01036038.1.p1 GENE.GFUD01036038.1~~GFUD01036038.1.p1  ORF type:complete len:707 (+),score=227.56 GFUD01036038.1:288-2408(+)